MYCIFVTIQIKPGYADQFKEASSVSWREQLFNGRQFQSLGCP